MSARRAAAALRPRKSPLQARSRATVEAILEAAARVFAALGYAGTTTNKVAIRAGVSIGSLYEYFPSKDALLVALIERHMTAGEEILSAATPALEALRVSPNASLARVVEGIVRTMVEFHAHDRELHRVLFEETPLPPALRERLTRTEQVVAARIAEAIRGHSELRVGDVELAAAVVVQTVEGLTHRMVLHGELGVATDRWVEEISRLVIAYLTTPAPALPTAETG